MLLYLPPREINRSSTALTCVCVSDAFMAFSLNDSQSQKEMKMVDFFTCKVFAWNPASDVNELLLF